jgi:hypothetical protein
MSSWAAATRRKVRDPFDSEKINRERPIKHTNACPQPNDGLRTVLSRRTNKISYLVFCSQWAGRVRGTLQLRRPGRSL